MNVNNAREQSTEGVKRMKGEKVKGRVEQKGTDGQVMMMAVPIPQKKRLYIKRDMEYWNQRKVNLIKIKQDKASTSATDVGLQQTVYEGWKIVWGHQYLLYV